MKDVAVVDSLFCFGVVLHLEDVQLQCLLVLFHLAEDYRLCFVEVRIWQPSAPCF